jgi:ribose 5-phosphate isomerase B
MRVAFGADERTALTDAVRADLEARGHEIVAVGPVADGADEQAKQWAEVGKDVGGLVVAGECGTGVLFCWTGTGASIAANKVPGVRAALCQDAATAAGARRWNDANALALSLRATSEAELSEILDAWFSERPSADADDRANVEHLSEIEHA